MMGGRKDGAGLPPGVPDGPEGTARPLWAGVDSGSWTTKAVVIDAQARVLGRAVVRSGADLPGAAAAALQKAAEAALFGNRGAGEGGGRGSGPIDPRIFRAVWSTGFGRRSIPWASGSRTELDCHARGVRHYVAGPLTVIDIGGQDAKVIHLDGQGRRISHKMNRKCAAGTGSFLDEMALRLDIPTERMPELAAGFVEEVELGSFCTVFSGTELLAAIRQGKRPADLARAAYKSVVKRVLEMDLIDGTVVATGGVVAHHPAVVALLERALGRTVTIPPHPQEMGAFGAALAAREEEGPVGEETREEARS